MKQFSIIIALFLLTSMAFAQNDTTYYLGQNDIFSRYNDSTVIAEGKVIVDKRVDKITNEHIALNQKQGIRGYRVQIFLGTGRMAREKAQEQRSEFLKKYPEFQAYLVHDYPYFKVRVGDFRTRNEAMKLKKQLKSQFVNTWVVADKINYPALNR